MRMKKISTLLAVPFLAVSLAACGGSDDSVSKEQFADGFTKAASEAQSGAISDEDKDLTKKLGGCIYDKVKDDVSGDTLKTVADGDAEKEISKEDNEALSQALQECGEDLQGELDQSSSTD
ncbi:MAG: hypothetical protein Q3979_04595 [Actinomycetaceae bacterium]|nr:hypothetical protein [Actinomycetaceae bacterium]